MSYCINPWCRQRQNPDELEQCQCCGTPLLINGQFRLLEPLRSLEADSSTEVFEVIDEKGTWVDQPGTHKVMKVLNSNNSKLIELMEREANVLQLIETPGIPRVDVDGFFTFQFNKYQLELYCLVMEKIPGQNLDDWVEINGKIPQFLALNWLKQIVEILDRLHSFGFFHRDIKPTNIILKPDGRLALIDFGAVRETTNTYMAKVSRGLSSTTEGGGFYNVTVIRTACYTPMEQLNGKAMPQSDFYALGRTFVYLLTGIPLLDLPSNSKTGQLMWRDKAQQVDEPFANFINEMMAYLPGKRPQNTQIILQRLEQIPFQSKLNRVVNSNSFKFSAVTIVLLLIFTACKASLPWVANYFFFQGKKAQIENRTEAAQKDFQLATNFDSSTTYSVANFYFEQASRNQGQPKSAKKYYDLAIKFNPKDVDAYNNLALVCQQLNNFKCVTDSYENALRLKPDGWESHYGLGNFYDEQGKYAQAEQQYRLAMQKSNQAVNAVNNLSRLKNRNEEYTQAAALALQGLNRTHNPQWQAALYKNLGWARLKQKRYSEAKSYLLKAIGLDNERTDAYCLLAQLQEALGEISPARISWEVCLIAKSNLPEVQVWRQQILERLWQR